MQPPSTTMPPPPDYEAVIAEEFRRSRAEGDEGLVRFIARHPDHPLADEARRLLAVEPSSLDSGSATGEPLEHFALEPAPRAGKSYDEDAVRHAYARARTENTQEALDAFVRRFPDHPLADAIRRQRSQ